jgi:hypothetical protein
VFVDRCIGLSLQGELAIETAAMAKYWTTDLQCKVVDECLQPDAARPYNPITPIPLQQMVERNTSKPDESSGGAVYFP